MQNKELIAKNKDLAKNNERLERMLKEVERKLQSARSGKTGVAEGAGEEGIEARIAELEEEASRISSRRDVNVERARYLEQLRERNEYLTKNMIKQNMSENEILIQVRGRLPPVGRVSVHPNSEL